MGSSEPPAGNGLIVTHDLVFDRELIVGKRIIERAQKTEEGLARHRFWRNGRIVKPEVRAEQAAGGRVIAFVDQI